MIIVEFIKFIASWYVNIMPNSVIRRIYCDFMTIFVMGSPRFGYSPTMRQLVQDVLHSQLHLRKSILHSHDPRITRKEFMV